MKTIISVIFIATLLGSNLPLADSSDIPPSWIPTPHEIIVKAATAFNIDPLPLYKVARCESSLDIHAIGDHGHAIGLLQFHRDTFDSYARKLGLANPDINSPDQQAQVAAYMFQLHKQSAWTCSKKVGILK